MAALAVSGQKVRNRPFVLFAQHDFYAVDPNDVDPLKQRVLLPVFLAHPPNHMLIIP